MQLMCNSSSEHSHTNGLGFINGVIREFSESILSTPHIGFNQVKFNNDSRLFKGINNGSDFYFSHSFRLATSINISHSTCIYIDEFFASFEQDNIAGVQFHPELSQTNGLKLLKNFIEYF
jgi:glutamine amidotransferase